MMDSNRRYRIIRNRHIGYQNLENRNNNRVTIRLIIPIII